ncbi:MAG: hypothetical protein KKB30_05875 [Proteobacteria bacterium]|nr:hypothetical protein [Pseudomonadota bacterium]MBU1716228.1 hypothetical protein [Pseudomonadota bacterium]
MHWTEHLGHLSKSLLAQISRIRNASDHGTTIGNCVEHVLRRTISNYIPRYFEVGTGQVCNINNKLSPQLDILIHDRSCFPPLAVNEDDSVIVCAEPTKSVVECKTEWDHKTVEKHFMRFTEVQNVRGEHFKNPDNSAGYLVFLVGSCPATIPDTLSDHTRFVGIYSLSKGKAQRSPIQTDTFEMEAGNALEMFLRDLLFDCMKKGQTEAGSFELSYETFQLYMK